MKLEVLYTLDYLYISMERVEGKVNFWPLPKHIQLCASIFCYHKDILLHMTFTTSNEKLIHDKVILKLIQLLYYLHMHMCAHKILLDISILIK